MFALRVRAATASRAFSTTATPFAPKVPVALIAQLRKAHPVPMAQAREALEKSNLDVDAAIAYLSSAAGASAQKKADKVAGRSTTEGAIAISLLAGRRVGMVHLACETDFVARNDVFRSVARGVAETAAFLDVPGAAEEQAPPARGSDPVQEFPVDQLLAAPLISVTNGEGAAGSEQTIQQLLVSSVSQMGENLRLQRAVSFAAPFPSEAGRRIVPGGYTHGGDESTGKIGGIVILDVASASDKPLASVIDKQKEEELNTLARNLARQVVGFPTAALSPGEGVAEEEALLTQPFMMGGSDKPVAEAVKAWAEERGLQIDVMAFRRWSTSDEVAGAEPTEAA